MRMSEIASKDIVNLTTGGRLGTLADCDFVINPESGAIEALIIVPRGRRLKKERWEIPWSAVRRVGPEVMIIDVPDLPKIEKTGEH
jgi:YlmC/YmxH family sporulation protein